MAGEGAIKRTDVAEDAAIKVPLEMRDGFIQLGAQLDIVLNKFKGFDVVISQATSPTKLSKDTKELTQAQIELEKIQKQITIVQARSNQEYINESKALEKSKQQLKEKTALGERDAKTVTAQNASVRQLQAALKANQLAYDSLTSAEKRNSKEGQELRAIILQQSNGLKQLKESTGRAGLEASIYSGTLTALKTQLKDAKDEMAGIAITLGDASPEFVQAAQKAGELQDQLNAVSEATKDLSGGSGFERVGAQASRFTDQFKTGDLTGATASLKGMASTIKGLTFKESVAGAGGFLKALGSIASAILRNPLFIMAAIIIGIGIAIVALKDKVKFLTVAFDAAGKALNYIVQLGKDFLDWTGATTFAFDDMTNSIVENAERQRIAFESLYDDQIKLATAAGKKTEDMEKAKQRAIIDTTQTVIDRLQQQAREGSKLTDDQKKQLEENIKLNHDAQIELKAIGLRQIADSKKVAEENLKAAQEATRKRLEMEREAAKQLTIFQIQSAIEQQQKILETESNGYEKRFGASSKLQELRKQLAKLELDSALKNTELTNSGRLLLHAKYQKELTDIEIEGEDQRNELLAKDIDAETKIIKAKIELQKRGINEQAQQLKNQLDNEINLIKQNAIEQGLTREQTEKQIQEKLRQRADDYVNIQIAAQEKLLLLTAAGSEERAAIEQKLFELRSQLTDAYYNQIERREETFIGKLENTLTKISEIYNNFSSGIADIFAGITERRLQKIEEEKVASEEKTKSELETEKDALAKRLEDETLTAEQRDQIKVASDTKQRAIEKAQEEREKQYEARKKQAIRRQAIFDKAVALSQAIIAGALAVVKALPVIPLSILAGALAAVQIGVIAARPIPAAAKGIKGHLGGPIIAAELGPELARQPNKGWSMLTKPGVYNMEPGTEIFDNRKSMAMIASGMLSKDRLDRQAPVDYGTRKELRGIRRAIENQKMPLTGRIIGYGQYGTRTKYLDSIRNRE